MNCSQVEILPKAPEIDQLRKELFQARRDAGYYKDLHSRNVAMREHKQYEHDTEIRKLKKKYQTEIDALQELIAKLQAKIKLRKRRLSGKKSVAHASSEAQQKEKCKRAREQQCGQKAPPKRKCIPTYHSVGSRDSGR